MRWKNTENAYGLAARLFHWGMAALIIALLALGLYMTGLEMSPDKIWLYGLHKATGILILFLVVPRLVWKLMNPNPKLPADMRAIDKLGAHGAHWALYSFMFALPLSGWIFSSAAGFPVSFYGLFVMPDLVSPDKSTRALMSTAHELLAYALILLIGLHLLAALWHHGVKKDNILLRMWSGKESRE